MPKEIDFPSQLAVKAAGTSINVVNRWLSRDLWPELDPADPTLTKPSKGRERRFEFAAVMQLALAIELIKRGIDVRRALLIGLNFTDVGVTAPAWVNRSTNEEPPIEVLRHPCRLFKEGWTWLLVTDNDFKYINDKNLNGWMSIIEARGYLEGGDDSKLSFSVIDAKEVFERVCRVLDYTPPPLDS